MTIGIVGAGNMGEALGKAWAQAGHQVVFSFSHSPQKLERLAEEAGESASAGTVAEAASQSEALLIAVPYPALAAVLDELDAVDGLSGKTVITCVSGLMPDFAGNTIGLPTHRTESVAEEIAARLPRANVVEAFNTAFAQVLEPRPRPFGTDKPSLFYCGDNAEAKAVTAQLIRDAQCDPVDAGQLRVSRSQETLATAWVQFAAASGLFPQLAIKALLPVSEK